MEQYNQNQTNGLNLPLSELFNPIISEGLQKFGAQFNHGVLVYNTQQNILFFNSKFVEQCHLPKELWNHNLKLNVWINYMIKRGDIARNIKNQVLEQLIKTVETSNKTPLIKVSPPNGKILEFKTLVISEDLIILFSEDVTNIRRNEETLDLALEMNKSGYFYYNADTRTNIIRSSYLSTILTAAELEQVRNEGFWPLIVAEHMDEAKAEWEKTVLKGTELKLTVNLKTQLTDSLYFKFNIRPINHQSGRSSYIIGFFEDVSELHSQQTKLQDAKLKTEQALKSKTDFLARISHEIRTPMNAVIGIADALIHHNKNPDINPKLELIQSSAGNILNILDKTLDHSKLDMHEFTLDPKPHNPVEIITQTCDLWDVKAKANNVTLRCHIENSVPSSAIFDKHRYEQCLNNLLSNAIKFTPDGAIDVICTRADRNGSPYIVLAVKDNGIGMTAEQQTLIFKAFKQADNSISSRFGGTGLGMNITKSLIERMGGFITVKSQIGQGSIFALFLPLKTKEEPKEELTQDELFETIVTREMQKIKNYTNKKIGIHGNEDFDIKDLGISTDIIGEEESPYNRLKILVADDNPTNHVVVKSLLDNIVDEIFTADHGQDVLDILDVHDIDIIFMDIHMPVMDGIEATLAIRSSPKMWSDVKIIAVTADPQYQQKRLCLNIGMDFAVAKPIKLLDVLQAIDNVLGLPESLHEQRKYA